MTQYHKFNVKKKELPVARGASKRIVAGIFLPAPMAGLFIQVFTYSFNWGDFELLSRYTMLIGLIPFLALLFLFFYLCIYRYSVHLLLYFDGLLELE